MTVMFFLYSTFVIYFCDVLSSRARARIDSKRGEGRAAGRAARADDRTRWNT